MPSIDISFVLEFFWKGGENSKSLGSGPIYMEDPVLKPNQRAPPSGDHLSLRNDKKDQAIMKFVIESEMIHYILQFQKISSI